MTGVTRLDPAGFLGLRNDIERVLGVVSQQSWPIASEWLARRAAMPLDLFESDEAYTALLDVPGVAAEDIEVTVHDGVLQVLAERKSAVDEKDAKLTGLRCERTSERMHRSLRLSARVTAESVYARLESGVLRVEALRVEALRVEVPKAEESKPRRVAVQKG